VAVIDNKLSGETYPIEQEPFAIEAVEFVSISQTRS